LLLHFQSPFTASISLLQHPGRTRKLFSPQSHAAQPCAVSTASLSASLLAVAPHQLSHTGSLSAAKKKKNKRRMMSPVF
jgi:hypothetical protein